MGLAHSKNTRAHEIDGIRGWAALSVLCFHVFQEMLGQLVPALRSAWLAPFLSGGLAVSVFFILSGDALTVAFFSQQTKATDPVDRLLVRRYTRLAIPVFLSCLFVFLLRKFNLDFHELAVRITKREDWLGQFISFDFSVLSLLKYSFVEVFTSHTRENSYNPFLWTMSVEMVGSMLVFLFCYLWTRLKSPQLVLFCLGIVLMIFGSNLSLFFVGMLFGNLRSQLFFYNIHISKTATARYLPMIGVGAVATVLYVTSGHHVPRHLDIVLACVFVFSVYSSPGLTGLFKTPISKWLGEISFPLYLIHFPILISFMSWLLVLWSEYLWDQVALVYIAFVTVFACLFTAVLFRRIERFLLNKVDRVVLSVLV